MSDQLFNSTSSSSNLDDDKTKLASELEEFVMMQRQRAQLASTVSKFLFNFKIHKNQYEKHENRFFNCFYFISFIVYKL